MKITGLTVSVGYSELLSLGLLTWKNGLDDLLVITNLRKDPDTVNLCDAAGVNWESTDAFWLNGAKFNKGRAIAEAYRRLNPPDWVLFFDADCVPPENWRELVEKQNLTPDNLYGARRFQVPENTLIPDNEPAGYFFLFHSQCPQGLRRPIVPTSYSHCGNYDSDFSFRWQRKHRVFLDLNLIHHGEPGKNWCGIGHEQEVEALHAARRAGFRWQDETIPGAGE